ncbi:MAG: Fe(3+) ABC transporter substrate-binding protein [Halioglobus sp.]|nr:Fe(3+) ABC transporter substrate-binding protein [Halioglobus sp.]
MKSPATACLSAVQTLTYALMLMLIATAPAIAQELNVYSARQEALIKPLLDEFSAETGITVNLVTGKGDALLTRLQAEGRNSPADILITSDAGRLVRAEEAGALLARTSPELEAAVPARLRSPKGYWYGLSVRARALVYNLINVNPDTLSTYEALAQPQWRGRICVRSSANIYNQSLVASMLATQGAEKTAAWLDGFVANFARPPQGGDRDQIKAVAAGLCDVAIVNSYYLGGMMTSSNKAERIAASKVGIFWPNQHDRGTHVNISGVGVTAASDQPELAVQLITFLTRDSSQQWYAETNNEYPVRDNVPVSELLATWGTFKADPIDVAELGKLNAQAVMAMDKAGWK